MFRLFTKTNHRLITIKTSRRVAGIENLKDYLLIKLCWRSEKVILIQFEKQSDMPRSKTFSGIGDEFIDRLTDIHGCFTCSLPHSVGRRHSYGTNRLCWPFEPHLMHTTDVRAVLTSLQKCIWSALQWGDILLFTHDAKYWNLMLLI
jgi:hypothetical protein